MSQGTLPLQSQIDTLTRVNLDDILDNFGLSGLRHGRRLIERLCLSPAQRLARQAANFDRRVGEAGLQVGAREWLMHFANHLEVIGAEHVPAAGGVIVAANHPGMTDTLVCFTGIPRFDLRVVSLDRPFLRAMGHVAERMIFVTDEANQRLTAVRQVARYLHSGGAVMIFPAGEIEPDPAVMPGAIESLTDWSDSLGMFVRLAPQCVVVPTLVSGVIYGPSLRHPLTRLRRAQKDRERVAASIQAVLHVSGRIRPAMTPRIEFGMPLRAEELVRLGDAAAMTHAITAAMRPLIERMTRVENPSVPG